MGTYSFYRNSKQASTCKINWDAVDTENLFLFKRLQYCYEERCETLEDVGKLLNESKLFGYMNWELREAILELNRHLIPQNPSDTPTLYFEWEGGDIAMALEFFTGTDLVNVLEYDYHHLMKNNKKLPSNEAFKIYTKVFEEIPYMDISKWNTWAL
jgi:hypothetical protein